MILALYVIGLLAMAPPGLLLNIGLPWAPFAAWICARSARKKGLDVRRHAVAGAACSALLFLPWVYLILRMNGGKVPDALVRLFYIGVFASWALGGATLTLIVTLATHTSYDMFYETSDGGNALVGAMYVLTLAQAALWVFALTRFLRRRKARFGEGIFPIDREYLIPPALAILSIAIAIAASALATVQGSAPMR